MHPSNAHARLCVNTFTIRKTGCYAVSLHCSDAYILFMYCYIEVVLREQNVGLKDDGKLRGKAEMLCT